MVSLMVEVGMAKFAKPLVLLAGIDEVKGVSQLTSFFSGNSIRHSPWLSLSPDKISRPLRDTETLFLSKETWQPWLQRIPIDMRA